RWRDIGDLRIELRDAVTAAAVERPTAGQPVKKHRTLRWILASSAALAAAGVVLVWVLSRNAGGDAVPVTRTTVSLAANERLVAVQTTSVAITNDGRR